MSLQHVANHLAQQGRGNDKMLVHMTPSEVAGLRSLAQAKGGDLTVNPHTGLPEAGFLDDLIKVAAPIALGALLGPAGYGLSSLMAGVATGGIMTLATGSLSRGLMAGLGAYGGADLAGGLSSAGVQAAAPEALASAEQGLAAGLGTDVGSEVYKNYLVENPGALGESVKAGLNNISPMDRISGGFNAVTASPDAAMDFAKNHWQAGFAAVAPIMADKGVQTTTAAPTNTGYIRQKIYDPVTHRTIDLDPVKASEWGSRKFSDIYQQPTANAATGGIVALAQGGMAHFAGGGFTDQQVADYITNIQAQGGGDKEIALAMSKFGVGADQVSKVTGVNAADVTQRAGTGLTSASTPTPTSASASTPTPTFKDDWTYDGLQGGIMLPPDGASGGPTISDQQIKDYIKTVKASGGGDDEIALAMNKYVVPIQRVANVTGLDAADVTQRYNTGIKNDVNNWLAANPTASDATIYNTMVDKNLTARQLAGVLGISLTGEGGVQDRYNLAHDIIDEGEKIGKAPKDPLGSTYDQTWAKYMDAHKDASGKVDPITIEEIARTTGISKDEIEKRYAAAKAAMAITGTGTGTGTPTPTPSGTPTPTPTPSGTPTPTPTPSGTPTPTPTPSGTPTPTPTTVDTPTIINVAPTPTLPPGVGGTTGPSIIGGGTTVNPNGTITVSPRIPNIPVGGFTGIKNLTDTYTKGGGSTGYFPQAPKTLAEFNDQFNTMTGDSLAAYNYLMGKGDEPIKTTAPQVSKSYAEAVLGIKPDVKTYSAKVKYIFDPVTHKQILNPNYDSTAANVDKAISNSTPLGGNPDGGFVTPTQPDNFDEVAYLKAHPDVAAELANGKATFGSAYGHYLLYGDKGSKIKDPNYTFITKPTKANTGGLMGMARGGSAHPSFFSKTTGKFNFHPPQVYADGGMAMGGLGSLGGYSDGGRLLRGPGDGVSDSIPASIGNRQPARLADGEFVVPARIVSEIGNGSTEAGARKLYQMMDRVQNARAKTTGKGRVAKDTNASKYLPV